MKRDFKEWLSQFRVSISNYAYYVDFAKVYNNVDNAKVELNILNSLVGSKNIRQDFLALVGKYPETIKCIPILLAVRGQEIRVNDENKDLNFVFTKDLDVNCLSEFMEKSGLFELISNRIINNLADYVLGVEVGLDSNGRKNRGGHLMEDVVENHLINAGFKRDENYFKEMYLQDIEKRWNVGLSALSNNGKAKKRFDFVVKTNNCIYAMETNFYGGFGGGSKLNETARSYKMLAQEAQDIQNFKFVWITDGTAWRSARNNLEETFDIMDNMYNLKELEEGVFKQILV